MALIGHLDGPVPLPVRGELLVFGALLSFAPALPSIGTIHVVSAAIVIAIAIRLQGAAP